MFEKVFGDSNLESVLRSRVGIYCSQLFPTSSTAFTFLIPLPMVMVIPTYRFWFHDYPREHTLRLASFLTFVAPLGLVLFSISSLGILTFVT